MNASWIEWIGIGNAGDKFIIHSFDNKKMKKSRAFQFEIKGQISDYGFPQKFDRENFRVD